MKNVKIWSVVLSVLFVILLLAACGADDSTGGSKTCNHSWKAATCESPQTCTKCYATVGTSIGHSWKAATCKAPQTCTRCYITTGMASTVHNYQSGKCVDCKKADPKDTEFKAAREAYNYLEDSHEICVDIMDAIYGAWHFSIYEADEYSSVQSCFESFCIKTGLGYTETLNALNEELASLGYTDPTGIEQLAALRVFSITVAVVKRVYVNNGTYSWLESNLSKAKTSLKNVTGTYADYTGYNTLKSYYAEVSAYAEFCAAPSGSFTQLSGTIEGYERNLRTYKNELSLIFG